MPEYNNYYASDTTERQTNSTDWTGGTTDGATRINSSNLSANTKYLIVARASFNGQDAANVYDLRINTGDDADIATYSTHTIEPSVTSTDITQAYFFVRSYTTDATPDHVSWQYKTRNASFYSRLKRQTLWMLDLDDLGSGNYIEASTTTGGSEYGTTFGDIVSITTLSSSKQYLVLGCLRTGMAVVGDWSYHAQLIDGASNVKAYHSREVEDTAEVELTSMMGFQDGATSTTIKIQAKEESASMNATGEGSYLIALDLSAFANYDYSFSATGQAITAGSRSNPEDIETLSFTRSNSANHLLLGQVGKNANNNRVSLGVEYNGTDPVDQAAGTTTARYDLTDQYHTCAMHRENITSNNTLALVASDIDQPGTTTEDEFLFILDLTKAGTALTMTPDGDQTRTNVLKEGGGTTNLYQSVDDDPDSPTTSDYIYTDGIDGSMFFDLGPTPADFESMLTASVRASIDVTNFQAQTANLYAQIFASNETTAYTDEVTLATQGSDGLVTVDFTVNATGLAASKADWDGARLKLRWDFV